VRQLVHAHSCGNRYRCHLSEVYRPFPDDVTPYDLAGLAVGNQLAEAEFVPIDDRARRRSKLMVAVTMSCIARAFASAGPTWAYSRFEKISYVDVLQFLLPEKYAGTALELFVFQDYRRH
jgi:hypothetical protein